jgi:SAM-dependent MidA family methyltransferase
MLRAAGFAGEVHFVETSPVLRDLQKQAVAAVHWHENINDLPARPLLLVANEFLDALPIRQHVAGIERRVLIAAGGLAFDRDGEIIETSPARELAVTAIATCLAAKGGLAIFVDYGHERSAPGDTLQAVRRHGFAPGLANPGEQDLTSHVDFELLAEAARTAGACVTPLVTQGDWLIRLGIEARAQSLSRANPDRAGDVQVAVDRLTSSDQMGTLFKIIAIHSADWPAPAGFQ